MDGVSIPAILAPQLALTALLAVVGIAEQALYRHWNRLYCLHGLPIFRWRAAGAASWPPDGRRFNQQAPWLRRPVEFHQFEGHVVAFRDWRPKYSALEWLLYGLNSMIQVMHCVLILEAEENRLVVQGQANWFTSLLGVVMAWNAVFGGAEWGWLGLGALAALYLLEARRAAAVARRAAGAA